MSNKRKQYNPQFKAKVALEAIRGEKTISELVSQYEVHATLINNWKRQLLDEASSLFEKGSSVHKGEESQQAQIDESDTPGEAGGLMSMTAPRAGVLTGGSSVRF